MVDTGGAQRHPAATERLMEYWAHGEGAAKIGWGTPGDFDRCVVQLSKYVSPGVVKGLCSNLHQRATGFRPGHAPSEGGDGHHSR
jgi:hypothetical protein